MTPKYATRNCNKCGEDFEARVNGKYNERRFGKCKMPRMPFVRDAAVLFGKPLSMREKQIVELLAKGLLNKEIAGVLHICEGSVKVFVSQIYTKLGISGRVR